MNPTIRNFLQDCYLNYLPDIQNRVDGFPKQYVYPYGNPIKPVMPVEIAQNKIMIIGAFPSARFEKKDGFLIPVSDNLSPFGEEKYFDGQQIRKQASRESLNINYFPQLNLKIEDLWITDLVKIYLFPEKHIKNCKVISPTIEFVNTHNMFWEIAKASYDWIVKEIEICNPSLIITLGEVPARVLSSNYKIENRKLLIGEIYQITFDKSYRIVHLAHPEIRRINKEWNERTSKALKKLKTPIQFLINESV